MDSLELYIISLQGSVLGAGLLASTLTVLGEDVGTNRVVDGLLVSLNLGLVLDLASRSERG